MRRVYLLTAAPSRGIVSAIVGRGLLGALACALALGACAVDSQTLLSRPAMTRDLARAGRILGETHPSVGRVISEAQWAAAVAATSASLPERLPRVDYLLRVAGLLDSLECGHVGIGPRGLATSVQRGRVSRETGFPLVLRWTTDAGVVVTRTSPTVDSALRGSTVRAVDGQPIGALVAEAARLAGGSDGDNESAARDRALRYLRSYLAWRDGPVDSFRVTVASWATGADSVVVLRAFRKADAERRADSLEAVARSRARERERAGLPPKPAVRKVPRRPIGFGYDTVRRVAVVEVGTMSGYDPLNLLWPLALRRVFRKVRSVGAEGLVLDLRGNGGGRSANVRRLVAALARETTPLYRPWQLRRSAWQHAGLLYKLPLLPALVLGRGETVGFGRLMSLRAHPRRKAFAGPVAVLIDSETFSAATITAAVLASSRRAPLLGQPSGGNYHETYAGLFIEKGLRRTGLELRVPLLLVPIDVDPRRQSFAYTLRPALTLPQDRAHVLAEADLTLLEALEYVGAGLRRESGDAGPRTVPGQ